MNDASYREALQLLRESATQSRDGEATRARIQQSLRESSLRRARLRRRGLVLLAATLATSGALAFYVVSHEDARTQTAVRSNAPSLQATTEPLALPPAPPATLDAPEPAASPSVVVSEPGRPKLAQRSPSLARASRRTMPAVVSSEVAPAQPSPASGDNDNGNDNTPRAQRTPEQLTPQQRALYMTAHRLQFGSDPGAALAAWDAFLAGTPSGPLAVEARYNRGAVLVRMGRAAEARAALTPFAAGTYGSFRKAAAELLLSRCE